MMGKGILSPTYRILRSKSFIIKKYQNDELNI